MSSLYHAIIFNPLYNILIFLFTIFPWADAGIAVILLTILVRLILYPLSKKAVITQVRMQEINPRIKEINERYKDNAEEKAKATLALYKETGVNPFSGILVLIIQLPIIWALYRIFLQSGFPKIDFPLLYSFVHAPAVINPLFLGIDITQKSVILALLAAATTFIQLKLATAQNPTTSQGSFGDDLAQTMQKQMKYFFPILVFFISYKISGVIALYWLTSNIFTIGQEMVVRRKIEKLKAA
ncbi:MAG: YidC/Oxa1 family membrane protein insertase [Patescibacteria group bacterium]